MSNSWNLIADIGGTNMRIAQVIDGAMTRRWDHRMAPGLDVARTLAEVVAETGSKPHAVVAAGAGPVHDGAIHLTNGGWRVAEDEITSATGATGTKVINDFEAAAWSLASLSDADVTPLGESQPLQLGHRIAIGPGTGLGVGTLVQTGSGFTVLPGEGGHVVIGPTTPDEVEIFQNMCLLWPEARIGDSWCLEAEALLSGTGLPFLFEACGGTRGTSGAQIFALDQTGDAAAKKAISVFRKHLAALAGDIAVTQKSMGGVFLLGGVAQSNPHIFDQEFWAHFASGGRMTGLRKSCGIYLVTIEDFGLRGCMNALEFGD